MMEKVRKKSGSNNTNFPFVSIIVTVLNERKNIEKLINSLCNLDYPQYEIIIIDGGSLDGTINIIKNYQKIFPIIKLIEVSSCNIPKGRNIGIRNAKGKIIAITDGDMIVPRNWIKELIKYFTHEDIGGVGGPNFVPDKATLFQHLVDIIPNNCTRSKQVKDTKTDSYLIATRNCAFNKAVVKEVGGFNESLPAAEDPELNYRILKSGYILRFTPDAIVYHNHRISLKKYFFQQYHYAFGTALFNKIHSDMICKRPKQVVPSIALISFLTIAILGFFYNQTFLKIITYTSSVFALFTFLYTISLSKRYPRKVPFSFYIFGPALIVLWYFAWGLGYILGSLKNLD